MYDHVTSHRTCTDVVRRYPLSHPPGAKIKPMTILPSKTWRQKWKFATDMASPTRSVVAQACGKLEKAPWSMLSILMDVRIQWILCLIGKE